MGKALIGNSGAEISPCGHYRYMLWRVWSTENALCNYIMLNPSTADAIKNDHTITKCIKRAKALGYGGIIVTNLFAYRSTYPKDLNHCDNPVGIDNDQYIVECAQVSGRTICAWGCQGNYLGRDKIVMKILKDWGINLFHLGLSKGGFPLHPAARGKISCIGYDVTPYPF